MKNFVQQGDVFDFIAPVGGVTSGTPVLISKLLVIPEADADATYKFAGRTEGIYTLAAKSTDTPSAGDLAYWDNTNDEVTTTALGNTFCGWWMEAKATSVTEAKIKLAGAVS